MFIDDFNYVGHVAWKVSKLCLYLENRLKLNVYDVSNESIPEWPLKDKGLLASNL